MSVPTAKARNQKSQLARASQLGSVADDGDARRKHTRAPRLPRAGGREAPGKRATILPRLLTISEAAEILNTSVKTVDRHIKDGELRAIKIGRLVRIDPHDLEDFIRDRRTR